MYAFALRGLALGHQDQSAAKWRPQQPAHTECKHDAAKSHITNSMISASAAYRNTVKSHVFSWHESVCSSGTQHLPALGLENKVYVRLHRHLMPRAGRG